MVPLEVQGDAHPQTNLGQHLGHQQLARAAGSMPILTSVYDTIKYVNKTFRKPKELCLAVFF